jgi:hypothetical protein
MDETWGVGNVVPALEVDIFDIPSLQLEKCFSSDAAAISGADKLPLGSNDEMAPIAPSVFLSGHVCNNVARGLSI